MQETKPKTFLWLYLLLAVLFLVLAGVGSLDQHVDPQMRLFLVLYCCVALAVVPIVRNLEASRALSIKQHSELLSTINEQMQQVCLLLNLMGENQLISDRTKAVAFREKDLDTVRRAIMDEIGRQNWEAALALVNDLAVVFGYQAEAERFRQEVAGKREEVVQRAVAEQMAAVDRYSNAEAWGQALQEAQRIMALFPNDSRVQHLPQEIESRKQACKKKLMDEWKEAVARHDVDGSIEILKHLDTYLSSAEAEGMQETARGVFKEKIGLLRTQFTMAVQDHRWAEAIRLGEVITTEFPNTKMAQEVRDMMESLRQRAAGNTPAAKA